jgi:hypothetical protein
MYTFDYLKTKVHKNVEILLDQGISIKGELSGFWVDPLRFFVIHVADKDRHHFINWNHVVRISCAKNEKD